MISDYYDNVHFLATLVLLAYLWWSRGDIYRPSMCACLRAARSLPDRPGIADRSP